MKPAELIDFFEKTSGFPGRVHEIGRLLRSQGLFPSGGRFSDRTVKVDEVLLLAWCLFTNTTRINLTASLSVVLAVEPNGRNFMTDWNDIFSNPDKLKNIKSVKLPDISTGLYSSIVFIDDSELTYGRAGHQRRVTVLSGDYLRELQSKLLDKKNSASELEREQPPFKNLRK